MPNCFWEAKLVQIVHKNSAAVACHGV